MITKLKVFEDEQVTLSVDPDVKKLTEVLYGTTMEWAADTARIAQKGVIYVYSDYARTTDPGTGVEVPVPGFKVGDGTSYLIDMPFAQGDINEEIRSHIANKKIHVSDEDRKRWDSSKIIIETENENLMFI